MGVGAHREAFFSTVGWDEITLLKVLIHPQALALRLGVLQGITHKVMLTLRNMPFFVECLILEVYILPALSYVRVGVAIQNISCETLVVELPELIGEGFIRL